MSTGKFNAGGNSIPGGSRYTPSHFRIGDKLLTDGPLGSDADLTSTCNPHQSIIVGYREHNMSPFTLSQVDQSSTLPYEPDLH